GSLLGAVAIVPVAGVAPDLGVGHDVIALVGFLALARFVMAASAWDTGSGFSLMGASRDLTISVFGEVTLLLSLAVAVSSGRRRRAGSRRRPRRHRAGRVPRPGPVRDGGQREE